MALLLLLGVLFLFHYTSYDRETGTLDAGAFDSYLRDVGDDDFSVIFMGFRKPISKDTRTSAYDSDVCGELFQNILPVPSAG